MLRAEESARSQVRVITVPKDGVSDSKTFDRIGKPKKILLVLKGFGLFANEVHPASSIQLHKSLVQSLWEHEMQLLPCTNKLGEEVQKVQCMFFGKSGRRCDKEYRLVPDLRRIILLAITRNIMDRGFDRRLQCLPHLVCIPK